ncbi:MAG: rhodanese-like domain-containing protein [Pseudomonadota bacterium]
MTVHDRLYQDISVVAAKEKKDCLLIDIRHIDDYSNDHITNALHVHSNEVKDFIAKGDRTKPLLVYCYHGISSRKFAQYLGELGFKEVYQLLGGYAAWQKEAAVAMPKTN